MQGSGVRTCITALKMQRLVIEILPWAWPDPGRLAGSVSVAAKALATSRVYGVTRMSSRADLLVPPLHAIGALKILPSLAPQDSFCICEDF